MDGSDHVVVGTSVQSTRQSRPAPRLAAHQFALGENGTHIVEAALPAVGHAPREHALCGVLDAREALFGFDVG